MSEWSSDVSDYLEGYLKQVAVLIKQDGGDPTDVVDGLRDHITNELGGIPPTMDDLRRVLNKLGTPEEVASLDELPAATSSASGSRPAPPPVPAKPPKSPKQVVVHKHRSPASCAIAVLIGGVVAMFGLAVLGILASIMLPALVRSREAARRAECQNNLKQAGIMIKFEADESDGRVIPIDLDARGVVFDVEVGYPDTIDSLDFLACSSGENSHLSDEELLEPPPNYIADYLYISHVVTSIEDFNLYIAAVSAAKASGEAFDGPIVTPDGTTLPRIVTKGGPDLGLPDGEIPILVERSTNHVPEGYNVLFLDGHVEFIRVGGDGHFLSSDAFAEAVNEAMLMQ